MSLVNDISFFMKWDMVRLLFTIMASFCDIVKNVFLPPVWKSVEGDVILITGGGHGLGKELAVELAKLGAVIVIWDIHDTDTGDIIRENGGICFEYKCDVSDSKMVYACAGRVRKDVGDVRVLINNAGIVNGLDFLDSPDIGLRKTFEVNVFAHFWTIKAFLPEMMAKNDGHIVNISSSTGIWGINKLSDYSASKSAVITFSECLNYEIARSGRDAIHVTTVCPAHLKTRMFEKCAIGKADKSALSGTKPLDLDHCVFGIIDAILTNRKLVCLPKTVYIMMFCKTFLPMDALYPVLHALGVTSFMDEYGV